MAVIFSGTGSCIPQLVVDEKDFLNHSFYDEKGEKITEFNERIIEKFKSITGIEQRRYAAANQVSSDLGTIAATEALKDAGIAGEALSGIIFAHNYGNIPLGSQQSDTVPSMASRVKHNLKIKDPSCITFDVMGGCPGWIQSVSIAEKFIKNDPKQKYLVIGSETLSRVLDPHDRDSMIYGDGAGAVVLENANDDSGILSVAGKSFTGEEVAFLNFGSSFNKAHQPNIRYIKMRGRKIYEFALTNVPLAMKECLAQSGYGIDDLSKVLLHQANEKMDEAILQRFYKLYHKKNVPPHVMPMSIHKLGNSSVATVPTLLDLVLKNKMKGHSLKKGDIILMASVGAGMNINAIAYKM